MATGCRLGVLVALGWLSAAAAAAPPTLLLTSPKGLIHLAEDGTLIGYRNDSFQWWQRGGHVAANTRNGTVCWVTAPENQSLVGNLRCALLSDLNNSWDLPEPEHFTINKAEALEIDPATGNWFITSSRDNYVCDHNFTTCARTGQTHGNVRFYAEYDLPNGLLYMINTDGAGPYHIDVVRLNGTGRHQIGSDELVDEPYAFAVDGASNKLYWFARSGYWLGLYRCDLEGQNREVIAEFDDGFGKSYRRSIAVVGDSIFVVWGDQKRVSRVDKNTKEVTHLVDSKATDGVTEVVLDGLLSLTVVSDSLHPADESGCAYENGGCPHLCVPDKVDGVFTHSCICHPGQELVDTACFDAEPATVVVVHKDSLEAVDVGTGEATTILSGLDNATKLNFFYKSKQEYELFWVDNGGLFRGHWTVGGVVEDVLPLAPAGTANRVMEVAVDWNSGNVVWLERNLEAGRFDDDGMRLKIASVSGNSALTLTTKDWRNPSALLVHSDGLYITVNQDGYFGYESWQMDGKSSVFGFHDQMMRLKLGYRLQEIVVDTSAISDPEDTKYFWINPVNGSIIVAKRKFSWEINSVSTLLTDPSLKNAGGLDVLEDLLFWADNLNGRLMAANSKTGDNIRPFGTSSGGGDLRAVRILHPRKQPDPEHRLCDSQKNGCSDMCVYVIQSLTRKSLCLCPDGKTLGSDGKTCQ